MSEKKKQSGGSASDAQLSELREQVARLEAENAVLTTRADTLRKESARYRVARNDALREASAYRTVVKAHNIAFSPEEHDLTSLRVNDGAIEGEIEYSPKSSGPKDPPKPSGTAPDGLTMDAIRGMDRNEIMARWTEVQEAMKANAN